MRASLLSLAVLLFGTAPLHAQVDVNKMIQERMAKAQAQGGQGGANNDVKIEDDNDPFVPNTFIGSFTMEMHHFANGVEDKDGVRNMHYFSSADKTLNQMDSPEMRGRTMKMLTDLKNKWTYMLMTDEKGKRTAMKSHKKKVTYTPDKDEKKPEVTVTNETKVIDGHTCTKVIAKSEEGTWTGWVAKDVPMAFGDMMRSMQARGQRDMSKEWAAIQGFPLEYEWVDKDGKDKMVVYIRDLKMGAVDESVFSLDGYEVMEMPSYGR